MSSPHDSRAVAAPAVSPFASLPELAADTYSGADIAAELRRVHDESVQYWTGYDTAAFFTRPRPEVWAPADQVRHLTKSVRAVNTGLLMPRLLLLFSFGWARRGSRPLDRMRSDYHAALARGARAGRFAPQPLAAGEHDEAGRARLMTQHAETVTRMVQAIGRWSERALDRYRLPHPVLGKLTVREMLLFTLVHNVHHVHVAERRRRESIVPA